MREIKFRAWDTEDKRWVKEFNIHHDGDLTEIRMYVGDVPVIASNVCGRYKILQFTGLKDKNGKEIYEGDILMHPDKRRKYKSIVKYRTTCCEEYGDWIGYEFDERLEIVGNIYENPKLMVER